MKKVLLSILAVVSVVALAITGTVAYLQSEDEDVNVMTLGKVKIAQHEYERVVNADGTYKTDMIDNRTSYVLKDFTQAKPLLPIVGDPTSPTGYLHAGYDATPVRMSQVKSYGGMDVFAGKNAVDKFVTVENIGKTDAYIRTLVAIEVGTASPALIGTSYHQTWTVNNVGIITIDNNTYYLKEFVYAGAQLSDGSWRHENGVLPAGDTSYPNLSQVYIKSEATNEDMEKLDGNGNGTLDILVLSQAVQTNGFADAETALNAGFGDITTTNHPWVDGVEIPAVVNTPDELVNALAAGGEVILSDDITDVNANSAITVAAGKDVTLDLNGHKITATANKTGNQELFLVKGTMTVKNGTLELTAENNQGWNSMATIFDVTAGGVLKVDGVTANVSGTDMNFFVHLNNWGSATLEMTNCDITTTYVAVRAFNSGKDMNTVTIQDSNFYKGRMFWVHNYTAEGHDDSTLNLDIYGNNNTCDNTKPVRFGFSNEVYYDINGNLIP